MLADTAARCSTDEDDYGECGGKQCCSNHSYVVEAQVGLAQLSGIQSEGESTESKEEHERRNTDDGARHVAGFDGNDVRHDVCICGCACVTIRKERAWYRLAQKESS